MFNECEWRVVKKKHSLQAWILKQLAVGMTNPALPGLQPRTDVNVLENGMTKMYVSSQSKGWVGSVLRFVLQSKHGSFVFSMGSICFHSNLL